MIKCRNFMSTGSSDTMEMRLVQAWFDYFDYSESIPSDITFQKKIQHRMNQRVSDEAPNKAWNNDASKSGFGEKWANGYVAEKVPEKVVPDDSIAT